MVDHIKEAVSKIKLPQQRSRWWRFQRIGNILWGGFVFSLIAILSGAVIGFAVIGYRWVTTWQ